MANDAIFKIKDVAGLQQNDTSRNLLITVCAALQNALDASWTSPRCVASPKRLGAVQCFSKCPHQRHWWSQLVFHQWPRGTNMHVDWGNRRRPPHARSHWRTPSETRCPKCHPDKPGTNRYKWQGHDCGFYCCNRNYNKHWKTIYENRKATSRSVAIYWNIYHKCLGLETLRCDDRPFYFDSLQWYPSLYRCQTNYCIPRAKTGIANKSQGHRFFNLISIGSNLQRHCDCPGHYHHQAILGCEVSGSQHTQGIAPAVQKCSRHSVISLYWWSTGKYILCSYLDYEWVKFRNVMYTICPVLVSWALITAHSSIPRWHEPSWDSTRSFQHVVPRGNTAVSFDQIAQGNKQPYIINAILMKRNGHWVWTVDFDASPQKRHKRSMIPPTSVSHDEVSAVVQTTGRTAPGASSVRSCDLNLRHFELGESPQLDCRLFWNFLYPFYCETWTSVSKKFLLQTTVSPKTNSQLAASSYKFEPSDMVREKGNWSVRMRYLDPCQAAAKENIDPNSKVFRTFHVSFLLVPILLSQLCGCSGRIKGFEAWILRPDSGANQIRSLK